MPNWCNNTLVVQPQDDSKEAVEQFEKFLKLIEANPDDNSVGENIFNRLYPMPESLRITSGSAVKNGISVLKAVEKGDYSELNEMLEYPWTKREGIDNAEDLIIYLTTGENKSANLDEARIALENKEKYGFYDWYEWSIANWGTKWDTGKELFVTNMTSDYISIEFSTAWSPPIGVFQKAAETFDKLNFEMEYAEPGMAFEGTFSASDGESTNETRDYDFTRECDSCETPEEDCEDGCPWGVDSEDYPDDCPCKKKK